MKLFLNDKLGEITFEIDRAPKSDLVLILAHGAGAGMHHRFLASLSYELVNAGVNVIRFNFPYMEQGRAPGSPKDAIETWKAVIKEALQSFPGCPIFVSGKSYGGRMASHMLAEEANTIVKGIIYYGFPLHAPGRDSKDRATHLKDIKVPQLFIQGTKDKLANFTMISEVVNELSFAKIHEIEKGDHSFNAPKSSGISKEEMPQILAKISFEWMRDQIN